MAKAKAKATGLKVGAKVKLDGVEYQVEELGEKTVKLRSAGGSALIVHPLAQGKAGE